MTTIEENLETSKATLIREQYEKELMEIDMKINETYSSEKRSLINKKMNILEFVYMEISYFIENNEMNEVIELIKLCIKYNEYVVGNNEYEEIINNIIGKVIDIIKKLDDKNIIELLNILGYSSEDRIELAYNLYEEGLYKKSLIILNREENISLNSRRIVLETKIKNYIKLNQVEDMFYEYEKLIYLDLEKNDLVIKEYYYKLLEFNELNRGIEFFKNYIKSSNEEKRKLRKINFYICKLYLRKKDILLAAKYFIKSCFLIDLWHIMCRNKRDSIIVTVSLLISLGLIFQYKMFSSGKWSAISARCEFNFDELKLYEGEEVKYKINIKPIPSYATNYELPKIRLYKKGIVDVGEDTIKGLKEGKSTIILYDGDNLLDKKEIEVEKSKVIVEEKEKDETKEEPKVKLPSKDPDWYMFYNMDKEYLNANDIKDLSKDNLAMLRNEIFARRGYKFWTEPYKSYFNGKNWYEAKYKEVTEDDLNEVERANLRLIQKYEKK